MGDYFDEEEKTDKKEKDDLDVFESEKVKIQFKDIQEISEQNIKEKYEYDALIKEYREQIGRLDLNVFGDPHNPDWESYVGILEEEIQRPETARHPISRKTEAVIKGVKEINMAYRTMMKLFGNRVRSIGKLLDKTILLFAEKEKDYLTQIEKAKGPSQVDVLKTEVVVPEKEIDKPELTQEEIDVFLEQRGNKFLIKGREALQTRISRDLASAKGGFVKAFDSWFTHRSYMEKYPGSFFDHLLYSSERIGPSQTQNIVLEENEKQKEESNQQMEVGK